MKRALLASIGLIASLAACQGGATSPSDRPELRIGRTTDGRLALELSGATDSVRAVQAELVIDGDAAFTLEEAEAPRNLPLDSVRMEMRGTNRAILFAGDKRGVLIPRSGVVATFAARATGGGSAQGSRISIASAVVAGRDGKKVDVALGSSIAVR